MLSALVAAGVGHVPQASCAFRKQNASARGALARTRHHTTRWPEAHDRNVQFRSRDLEITSRPTCAEQSPRRRLRHGLTVRNSRPREHVFTDMAAVPGVTLPVGGSFLALPGTGFRFAVGAPDGPKSSVYDIATAKNKSDVYLTAAALASTKKISFHESGVWQYSYISSVAMESFDRNADRRVERWSASEPFAPWMATRLRAHGAPDRVAP